MGVGIFVYLGEEYLVGGLVEDARDAQHEDGPAVMPHPPKQFPVEHITESREFTVEEEGDDRCAEQVDAEHISHACRFARDMGQHEEGEEVEQDIHTNEQQLQRSELHRFFLVAEVGERYALEGIKRYGDSHHPDVRRMVFITHETRDGTEEDDDQQHEHQPDEAHTHQGRGIDALRIFLLFVGEAEKCRFHAEGQDDQKQCHISIHIGDDSIATTRRRYLGGV